MIWIEGDTERGADVGTTKRKGLTPSQRVRLFEAHRGVCALCGLRIYAGEKWIDEHLKALGLGGSNHTGNRAPAHVRCADIKTGTVDMPAITKAKRQKLKALGLKESRYPPIPGTKRSGWKRKMDGTVERRSK